MKNKDTRTNTEAAGDGSNDARGLVERLLHAAGPGPEIPEDGAARVKELIRPAWRNEVTARSRQRNRMLVGGVAAAAALIIAMIYLPSLRQGTPALAPQPIIVSLISGTLEVTPPGSNVGFFIAENTNPEIPRGSLIRSGPESRAALGLTDQRSLRLDFNTELRLDSEASVSLESGAVYIDSRDDSDSGIEVRTAFGTATDVGTQFEVRLEQDTLDVKVRKGLVALIRDDEEFQITQGITLSVDSDGAVSTGTITPYDPAWTWTQEIAPIFEIEGRSVLAFLDWVSNETGLSVRFQNVDVEELAAITILHGSIEGLTPTQAPAVILPSARLTASEELGGLIIRVLETNDKGFDEPPLNN